jgi:hypothetical protein
LEDEKMTDDIKVFFRHGLTADQRDLAQHMAVSTVERTRAEVDAIRARYIEEDKLSDIVKAPVAKLIQADPDALEALKKLGQREFEITENATGDVARRDHAIIPANSPMMVQQRTPPFDYAWNWHDAGGGAPFNQISDITTGHLRLDARTGNVTNGVGPFVHAHTGFGCFVNPDRPFGLSLSASWSLGYGYLVGARGISVNASADGGLETSFFRGGERLMGGTIPLWHRRVSGPNETAQTWVNPVTPTYPNGMGTRIDPGAYAFNAGVWAFADHSSGVGGSGAQSLIDGYVLSMTIDES